MPDALQLWLAPTSDVSLHEVAEEFALLLHVPLQGRMSRKQIKGQHDVIFGERVSHISKTRYFSYFNPQTVYFELHSADGWNDYPDKRECLNFMLTRYRFELHIERRRRPEDPYAPMREQQKYRDKFTLDFYSRLKATGRYSLMISRNAETKWREYDVRSGKEFISRRAHYSLP